MDDADGYGYTHKSIGCVLPSAAGVCNLGQCQIVQCLEGAQNCDGLDANGCELLDAVRGDCKRKACSGGSVADDTDLPLDDGNECTIESCSAGTPVVMDASDGNSCGDGGQCENGDCVEE